MHSAPKIDERPEVSTEATSLRLIWKHPETRRYHEIGKFSALVDGSYVFEYNKDVAEVPDFTEFGPFPNREQPYVSKRLPAFFANRVMSQRRPSFDEYIGWLGLNKDAAPVEILARTGGGRATDTFHLVEDYDRSADMVEFRFFVSGIRHRSSLEISSLKVGAPLEIQEEPDNVVNPRALLLTSDGSALGWIPDWLVNDVHELRDCGEVKISVDRINEDAPARLQLMCKLKWTRR